MRTPLVVRPGDRVRFDGKVRTVAGVSGMLVRLADEAGGTSAMHLPPLMMLPGFEVLGSGSRRAMPTRLLDHVPTDQAEKALWWHGHMVELRTGLPPDARSVLTRCDGDGAAMRSGASWVRSTGDTPRAGRCTDGCVPKSLTSCSR
nr:hypothetical protein OG781_04500 [Streptomyces sp. NBC_00830]